MDTLSDLFRLRRISLGMTQAQAAVAAGLATRTVSAFEGGQGRISLSNLRRLMAVVGLELSTREASTRPTLDELSQHYEADEAQPSRKRAPKQPKTS
jgi:transcriptional regulator with XRE-family HTH domain